jgi:hypothetical protein
MTLREYSQLLRTSPSPLTIAHTTIAAVTAVVVAASRLLALSRSLWDWDEAQFCSAVRSYDVSLHHPHPPGYPLFIAAAKIIRPLAGSDFGSLQTVVVTAALLLFPAFFILLRELRFPFGVALGGSTLLAFMPTVWYHGGTAFSDVPALCLILSASAALLRSVRQRRFFLVGCVLLGAALGFRPQSLIVAVVPLIAACCSLARRSRRLLAGGLALCGAIVAASYGGAALASASVPAFVDAVLGTSAWVSRVDSFRNPLRPPLPLLFVHFLVAPIGGGHQRNLIAALALLSLIVSLFRRRIEVLLVAAMFVPAATFAWLMLDANAATRYAIAYLPLYAALSVDAVLLVASTLFMRHRRLSVSVTAVAVALLVLRSIWWTLPALRVARSTASPPARSMQWIRQEVVRRRAALYLDSGLDPFADYYLPDYPVQRVDSEREVPQAFSSTAGYYAMQGTSGAPEAVVFTREHGRLWNIARQRYFEVSVVPIAMSPRFEEGWYGQESSGHASWRWMGGRSRTVLAPMRGRGLLQLSMRVPDALKAPAPTIQIRLNGTIVGRLRPHDGRIVSRWSLLGRSNAPNELIIETDRIVNPSGQHRTDDHRDLGLELLGLSWTPEEASQR